MTHVARLLVLLLALFGAAYGHDPVLIDAEITVDGTRVVVHLAMKPSAALAGIGDHRSQVDPAELDSLAPRLAAWLKAGARLTADGVAVPMEWMDLEGGSDTPLAMRLSGALPEGAHRLALTLSLLRDLPATISVIDTVHLAGSPALATVRDGEEATLALDATTRSAPTLLTYARLGFLHILPEGLDHILFVLGLFLLSPRLKPLLWQITAFTAAHSLTLGLAISGAISAPPRIVEPLIAASIAAVAIENIVIGRLAPWRWAVVFGFGLVHGLGFAAGLAELRPSSGGLAAPLIGFNLGVEGGQLTVVACAAAVTAWCRSRDWYRPRVAVPASAMIAATGLFWAGQRVLG
jgi:hypothetical protein